MGGGTREKGTESAAAGRDSDAREAFERDRPRQLNKFPEGVKPRVFISFHIEDEAQVNLLRHQAGSSNKIDFTDYSVKEPFEEKWKTQCTERIKQSSAVVVAIGSETHSRPAIQWEIEKAHELGKPVIGMKIHRDAKYKVPQQMARHGDKVIDWNLDRLQAELDKMKDGG